MQSISFRHKKPRCHREFIAISSLDVNRSLSLSFLACAPRPFIKIRSAQPDGGLVAALALSLLMPLTCGCITRCHYPFCTCVSYTCLRSPRICYHHGPFLFSRGVPCPCLQAVSLRGLAYYFLISYLTLSPSLFLFVCGSVSS